MDGEVVVRVDGIPRPAVVVATEGDRTRVRFRDAGGQREEWVLTSSLVPVEVGHNRPPLLKLIGLGVVGVLGLALLLYPGGSDKPLLDSTPSPSPVVSALPSASPTAQSAGPVTIALFGDSLFAGRGTAPGTTTLAQTAAKQLGWTPTLLAEDGTGYTTSGNSPAYGERLAKLTTAPDVLLLEGGASDTNATHDALAKAANTVIDGLQQRFPKTKLVLMGPVAMEQPVDAGLARVSLVLKQVAAGQGVPYIDVIGRRWITADNAGAFTAATGFYPNAAGHAYLANRLAPVLKQAVG